MQATLFGTETVVLDDPATNTKITYHPSYLPRHDAATLLAWLRVNAPWQREMPTVYGKTFELKRQTCAFGDADLAYHYSGVSRVAVPWPEILKPLADRLADTFQAPFNFGLCNLYPDGEASIGKHADDEREIVKDSPIVGLSLGAERDFVLYDAAEKRVAKVALEHGSIVVMHGATQRHYKHAVPKRLQVKSPRVSVTFRVLVT